MERFRRERNSYRKLSSTSPPFNQQHASSLRRTRSVRASFRLLRSKGLKAYKNKSPSAISAYKRSPNTVELSKKINLNEVLNTELSESGIVGKENFWRTRFPTKGKEILENHVKTSNLTKFYELFSNKERSTKKQLKIVSPFKPTTINNNVDKEIAVNIQNKSIESLTCFDPSGNADIGRRRNSLEKHKELIKNIKNLNPDLILTNIGNENSSVPLKEVNLKIFKRSATVAADGQLFRTATIRKESVWANSNYKIALPDLVTRSSLLSSSNNNIISNNSSSSPITTPIRKKPNHSSDLVLPTTPTTPTTGEGFRFPHFRIRSPLFRQTSKSTHQEEEHYNHHHHQNLAFESDSLDSSKDMEFIIPQPLGTKRQQQGRLSENGGKLIFNNPIDSNHNSGKNKTNLSSNHSHNHNKHSNNNNNNNNNNNSNNTNYNSNSINVENDDLYPLTTLHHLHNHHHHHHHFHSHQGHGNKKPCQMKTQHQQQQQLEQHQLLLAQEIQLNHKMTKKQLKLAQAQLEKLTQINIHLHALFSAVEHGHLEKAKTILESTDVDVNSLNSDGLSPLDVAVLSNNRSMTKMLLQHGATEGSQFKTPDSLGNHLNGLLHDAENRVQDLSCTEDIPQQPFSTRASFSSIIGNSAPSVTGCAGTEADKQLGLWERRVKGLRRMLLGWDQARPPDTPKAVTVDVSGVNSVSVCILEPNEGPIGTKFKVQWSTRADFSNIVGEREIFEWSSHQGIMGANCRISDLTQGRRYFFRASCGNVKGWGSFQLSIPTSIIPSSWRDVDNREHRFAGRQRILDDLFTAVRLARPEDASELSLDAPAVQRRNPKKKTTIKQLFSAASKFQKNLRRGIYLACILYYDDKILVTNEDFLPVIEIDETYPSSLHTDYHWLMKVACTWDDVKSLRTDMERNSTSAAHFRTKLLSAACQMQSVLCITDLGQLYHKPLKDSHGTVVLCCINSVKSPKSVSVLNSRWVPLNKIQKKITALHEDNNINEILISSISEQINYHQTSTNRLSRGLYLGYLKMQSSVDQIQVVVPVKTPNVLPHSKIRDNPHISAEEWEVLKRGRCSSGNAVGAGSGSSSAPVVGSGVTSFDFHPRAEGNTEVQKLFLEALTAAAQRLFNYMNISSEDALTHRLYDIEVIELSSEVSFLILCPPVESSCAVPGQREILLQRGDLLSLPVQAFEMVHLRTYQNSIIQKYSRLSCILELDTAQANHSHREAFSTLELQTAKERLSKLQELTSSLNAVWKGVRWLMDVIGFARDRGSIPGVTIREIIEFNKVEVVENDICSDATSNRQLLQLPQRSDNRLIKSSPGRGSWPGPAANNNMSVSGTFLVTEHSKSEQNLGCSSLNSRFLSTASSALDGSSRKNSADSQSGHSYYSAGEGADHVAPRLPPSRSEDTLVLTKKRAPALHRRRGTTIVTNITATSSPHLSMKPYYKGTTDSLQSLSSDSESSSCPLSTNKVKSSPKSKPTCSEEERIPKGGNMATTRTSFLKPTLTALQNEIKLSTEHTLHISEDALSPKTLQFSISENKTPKRQSSDEEGDTASDSVNAISSTTTGATSTHSKETSSSAANVGSNNNVQPGIIQVYAAYETGLAQGTSLKLHVTPKTSAREVVDLVVKQLNMAVVLKGKDGPIYTPDKLENFCLVAVIGARERCLRDDFKPLQLQNPWKKGRLYVRQKTDLLAAIEHSNRDAQLI